MKKILIIIVLLIIATAVFFVLNNKQEPMNTNQNVTPTVSQEEDVTKTTKLSVELPDGWEKVAGSVLEHQYMKNTASFMIKNENFSTTNLSEITIKAISSFQGAFDDVVMVEEVSDTKVGGYDAKEFTFTAKVGSLSMEYRYIYTVVAGQVYAITFGDMESTFNNYNNDYQDILGGITFVEE